MEPPYRGLHDTCRHSSTAHGLICSVYLQIVSLNKANLHLA